MYWSALSLIRGAHIVQKSRRHLTKFSPHDILARGIFHPHWSDRKNFGQACTFSLSLSYLLTVYNLCITKYVIKEGKSLNVTE